MRWLYFHCVENAKKKFKKQEQLIVTIVDSLNGFAKHDSMCYMYYSTTCYYNICLYTTWFIYSKGSLFIDMEIC